MVSCFSCGSGEHKDITDQALDEARRELKKNRGRKIGDVYHFGQVLGKGGFGKVRGCWMTAGPHKASRDEGEET